MRDRKHAFALPRFIRQSATLLALVLCACGPPALAPPAKLGKIIAVVRPGPAVWFPAPNGDLEGLDHDLLVRFAREAGIPLEIVQVDSAAALIAKVAKGEAHIGIGGLFQAADTKDGVAPPTDVVRDVLWTTGYLAVEPVLIYNVDGYKPRNWLDLAGATVAYLDHTGIENQLAFVRLTHSDVQWKAVELPSADALIAQVAEGDIDYAVVTSRDVAAARNAYADFELGFTVGPKRELAWAVAPNQSALRNAIDAFLAKLRASGELARLGERYYETARAVERIDAGIFRDRIKTMLPQYRKLFEQAQDATGLDWRLIAAVAYQESQWDPGATSETGAQGLMQLTEETARRMGVADRMDTNRATLAGARYLADIKAKLPTRIGEPDRTWLALAAFNIGAGHLEDARVLAQRQKLNPDLWSDVKKALPLLADPDYYIAAKNGYARGGMPVAHVDRIRTYYDILARTEPPYRPRLSTFGN